MKSHSKNLYAAMTIFGAMSVLPLSPVYAQSQSGQKSARVFSEVYSPEIPRAVTFAGQKIDLDRVDMYERLDRELTSMAYTHGNTQLVLKRANKYFPEIIPILRKNGIHEDLVYIACIESFLNPRAVSVAGAAGVWQFMKGTGQQYGLEINQYVDERYNLEKATEAACKYFRKAYEKYGNWESVAASYNAGTARISKELDAQKQTTAYNLFLNDETSRYIYRMISMKLIMENPQAYGYFLSDAQLYQPVRTKTVTVDYPVENWAEWASKHGISYMQLRDFNPWIRDKSLPNKTGKAYSVKIPELKDLKRSSQQHKTYNSNWTVD